MARRNKGASDIGCTVIATYLPGTFGDGDGASDIGCTVIATSHTTTAL
jgi:hypothetical protein